MLFTLNPDGEINGVVETVGPAGEPYPRVRYRELEKPIPTNESAAPVTDEGNDE